MMRDSPDVWILDLREPAEFAGEPGHLRSAKNLPLSELDRRLQDVSVWRELAALRSATFLVYCRGGDSCGEEGTRRLIAGGYKNAVLLEGGIRAWVERGYGVLGPEPSVTDDPTLGRLPPTHLRRLADGALVEGGRDQASGLYVPGRIKGERFLPSGGVEGWGEFCSSWRRRSGKRPRTGWMELRTGLFHDDASPRDPARPYVRGCVDADGLFRPESREVH